MKKRTGIFGGSFDPVHNGHISLVRSFLKSGLIDDLLILLTPDPPHKKDIKKVSYLHRMEMLKLAFPKTAKITISDLETTLPLPSYTFQTIQYLEKNYPDICYYLCIGEDSLAAFETWYKYEEILARVDLLTAERPGYDTDRIPERIKESVIFADHIPVDLSSTRLRSLGNKGIYDCPQSVIDYIRKHRLYEPC